MNTTGTEMPQVYVGRFFEPASFSTGFHGKLSSSSANSAHFGKTNKLREKQENLDNSYFCAQKAEGVGYGGKKTAASAAGEAGEKQKSRKACLVQPSLPGTCLIHRLNIQPKLPRVTHC